jgi:hypothetical protein
MLWKIYIASRASNGMPASKHYKIENSSMTRAVTEALGYIERHYKVVLIEIIEITAHQITQEQWDDTSDNYEVLH